MKPKFNPILDRVLILPDPSIEVTPGGVLIPDTAIEKPVRGTVVSTGPGKMKDPMTLKEGEVVLYNKHTGAPVNLEGVDYLIMRECEVSGVLDK
jgi:chaperonin GroES